MNNWVINFIFSFQIGDGQRKQAEKEVQIINKDWWPRKTVRD